MPAEARPETEEGLLAFAEHWYALVNYTYETGDAGPLKAISGPNCQVANHVAEVVETGYRDDDWMTGGDVDINYSWSEFEKLEAGHYVAYISLDQDDIEYYAPGRVLLGSDEGTEWPVLQGMAARYTATGWIAEDVVTLDVPDGPPEVTSD